MSNLLNNWIPYHVNPPPSDHVDHISCVGDLVTVAHRISECNRIRVVEGEYDNDTAVANCVALNNTHFRITLYQGEPEGTQGTIIVDMRSISGSSVIFQEEYRAILSAAKFGEIWPREALDDLKITPPDTQYKSSGYTNVKEVQHKTEDSPRNVTDAIL